jgi:hypothetical protein
MKLWISISLSLFLFSIEKGKASCDFNESLKSVYSLSGPVTIALKELELLKSKKLKGLSVFHPITDDEFEGEFLPGGIFLSREYLSKMKESLIFLDESRELSRMLKGVKGITLEEIQTRGLTPLQVTELVVQKMKKYLSGCDSELLKFQNKSKALAKEILSKLPVKLTAVFYLGQIRPPRVPDMAIVNDGVVKWLKDSEKLKTYPSTLAYVNWSAKIIQEMPENTLHIGVVDSGRVFKKEVSKINAKRINFTYPGSLIPGLSQQEAWLYLINSF